MRKRMIPLLGLLLCGCSETVCEPCQSFSAPTCEKLSSEIAKESVPEENAEQSSSSEEGGWKDDSLITDINACKRYAETPRVEFFMKKIADTKAENSRGEQCEAR